jgi:TRAP-type C4-dicarboxylate transport system permease small subunit
MKRAWTGTGRDAFGTLSVMDRRTQMKGIATQRLIALFGLFFVLLQYPLLQLANKPERVLGLPVLFVYVFCCWALLIAAIALVMHLKRTNTTTKDE